MNLKEKRILYITRNDPFIKGGGSLATHSFIKGINKLFPGKIDVILADSCCADQFDIPGELFFVPPRPVFSRYISLLTGTLHRFKPYVFRFLSQNRYKYFMCIFDGSLLGGDIVEYVNSLGIKTITIHHNYEKEYHIDNKTVESFKGYFPFYVIRNERNSYLKSSLNLFLTNQDKNKLTSVYGQSKGLNSVIGVFESENHHFKISSNSNINGIKIIISGTMSTYQTIRGVQDFYSKYYSIVKTIYPDVEIIITGRDPDKEILDIVEREYNNLKIIPNPKEIQDVVNQGNIYLCPTCIGGGLKLRLMDGLKAGLPVLVHAVSARGYDVFFDKPWFQVYSDEESFQTGFSILVDLIKRNEWSPSEIQKAYFNYFSFNEGVARLDECFQALMNSCEE